MVEFDFPLCSETTDGFPDGLMAALENIGEVTDAVAPTFRNCNDCRGDLPRATRIERSELLRDSHFMQDVKDGSVSEAVYVPVPRFQHFLRCVINGRHASRNCGDEPLPAMKKVNECRPTHYSILALRNQVIAKQSREKPGELGKTGNRRNVPQLFDDGNREPPVCPAFVRNPLRLFLVINRHFDIADVCAFRSFSIPNFIWLFAKILRYEGFELIARGSC